ncbi:MAG: hypothetical protein WKF73_17135, partial [Nocardioidaceae bacterium]
MAESEQEVLTARLARYPADRYPVQHATTQFHLGSVLLHAGETGPALQALATAREHFGRAGLHLEQAKAMVMVGVGLRTAGRSAEAASAFAAACAELDTLDQPAEEAAACYNLGLVLRERGDTAGAHTAWTRAREQFLAAGLPSRAAAAARDHGASLLTSGSVDAALPLLERATALAEAAGDGPGTGLAANALGLAHLAAQDCPAAVSALDVALGVFSRAVRPAEHAMVKANLALAHEQAGDHQRARLAARQALAIPGAAAPVRAQAQQVLARLPGRADQDLLSVLDAADPQQRIPVLRDGGGASGGGLARRAFRHARRLLRRPAGTARGVVRPGALSPAGRARAAPAGVRGALLRCRRRLRGSTGAGRRPPSRRPGLGDVQIRAAAVAAPRRDPQRGSRGCRRAGDMEVTDDLGPGAITAALGDRPVRAYPALLSTEAVGMAWAREGAPSGAVVVADYQASHEDAGTALDGPAGPRARLHADPATRLPARARGLVVHRRPAGAARRRRHGQRRCRVARHGLRRGWNRSGPARGLRRARTVAHRVGECDRARRGRVTTAGGVAGPARGRHRGAAGGTGRAGHRRLPAALRHTRPPATGAAHPDGAGRAGGHRRGRRRAGRRGAGTAHRPRQPRRGAAAQPRAAGGSARTSGAARAAARKGVDLVRSASTGDIAQAVRQQVDDRAQQIAAKRVGAHGVRRRRRGQRRSVDREGIRGSQRRGQETHRAPARDGEKPDGTGGTAHPRRSSPGGGRDAEAACAAPRSHR